MYTVDTLYLMYIVHGKGNTKNKQRLRCFPKLWIRTIWPDPDPLQETLIRIRVAKKNRDKLTLKSTKNIRIYFFFFRNHLFCFIYVNNKLINKKKTSLRVIPFTEKYRKKLKNKELIFVRFEVGSGSGSVTGPGSASK